MSALSVLRDVCVIGRIDNDPKTASGRNFIRIDSIRPVTDPYETYFHVLVFEPGEVEDMVVSGRHW